MDHGTFETMINSFNPSGGEFHPQHTIRSEWQRDHIPEGQYYYKTLIDGKIFDEGRCKDLTELWLKHITAARRIVG